MSVNGGFQTVVRPESKFTSNLSGYVLSDSNELRITTISKQYQKTGVHIFSRVFLDGL